MRVKYAAKAFADWSNDLEFYVVDGAVRKCASPDVVWEPFALPKPDAPPPCDPFGPRIAAHSEALGAIHRPTGVPLPLQIHAECSRWVEER